MQGVHSIHQSYRWSAKETGAESLAEALKQQVKSPPADSKDFSKVHVGPQQLRSFRIKYIPPEQKTLSQLKNNESKLRSKITLKRIDSKNLMKAD